MRVWVLGCGWLGARRWQIRGDDEVKQMRKMLAQEALSLSGEIDAWIEVLKD